MKVWTAFYNMPESEEEVFVAVAVERVQAVRAIEADAVEAGKLGWRWGNGDAIPNVSSEDVNLYTDWQDDDSGSYFLREEPLLGSDALTLIATQQRLL